MMMRAVTGSVVSSKPISLSKAAAILSRFASAETGARRDVAAYLKRASVAFDDLVQFHREVRSSRKRSVLGIKEEEVEEEKWKKKGADVNPVKRDEEINPRKDKGFYEADGDGNLTEVERDYGEERNEKRKKKKKYRKEIEEGERENFEVKGEEKVEAEKERSEDRKKKKEKKKRDRDEVEEGRDMDGKKRKHLDVEGGEGEVEDRSEQPERKKKRRKSGMED